MLHESRENDRLLVGLGDLHFELLRHELHEPFDGNLVAVLADVRKEICEADPVNLNYNLVEELDLSPGAFRHTAHIEIVDLAL